MPFCSRRQQILQRMDGYVQLPMHGSHITRQQAISFTGCKMPPTDCRLCGTDTHRLRSLLLTVKVSPNSQQQPSFEALPPCCCWFSLHPPALDPGPWPLSPLRLIPHTRRTEPAAAGQNLGLNQPPQSPLPTHSHLQQPQARQSDNLASHPIRLSPAAGWQQQHKKKNKEKNHSHSYSQSKHLAYARNADRRTSHVTCHPALPPPQQGVPCHVSTHLFHVPMDARTQKERA